MNGTVHYRDIIGGVEYIVLGIARECWPAGPIFSTQKEILLREPVAKNEDQHRELSPASVGD